VKSLGHSPVSIHSSVSLKEVQTVFGGKNLGDRDHFEDIGLYGKITLKWIFRLIQIIHMTPGQQSGKN